MFFSDIGTCFRFAHNIAESFECVSNGEYTHTKQFKNTHFFYDKKNKRRPEMDMVLDVCINAI